MIQAAKFEKVSFYQWQMCYMRRDTEEIYNAIQLPKRATIGSAGYDFFAPFDIELKPGESAKIPTGIRAKINEGWMLSLYPRSGLGFKFRLRLDNTVGIIDSDYYYAENEGHIMAKITNESTENKIVRIPAGTAFMQGIFTQYGVTYDDETEGTRSGGFGSTDIHISSSSKGYSHVNF